MWASSLTRVVAEPGVGLAEVVKDLDAAVGAARLQHDGGRAVHLTRHVHAVPVEQAAVGPGDGGKSRRRVRALGQVGTCWGVMLQ